MTTGTAVILDVLNTNDAVPAPVRFHLSLNVSDLPQAVAFFEKVLGVPAAKKRADYAKFELDSPPLVFSLEPRSPGVHGSLNHVGFRFPDSATLVDVQRRLEQAGIRTAREEGVECCYARQTKFWVNDLDHRLWEFYVLEGDIDHRGAGQTVENMIGEEAASQMGSAREPVVYEYFMGQPFSPPSEPCDEIRLRGTFNLPVTDAELAQRLNETRQHLKPGGKIHLHQLTSDSPVLDASLSLPGRASIVKHVPVRSELLKALHDAGFRQIALTKFGSKPCFTVDAAELRETMIEARTSIEGACQDQIDVVYKGPFESVQDDEGHVYPRGARVSICGKTWSALESAGVAGQFTRITESCGQGMSCGTSGPM
jgi:catechol 2,3-dioxygenase-like lactoylglutathione lyase family enzyme